AETLTRELDALGVRSLAAQVDSADLARVREMIARTRSELGEVHALVNNAGITKDKLLMMMGADDWKDVVDTNLTGVVNFCPTVITPFIKGKSGAILCVSSACGCEGMTGRANYSASTAGLVR